MIQKKCKQFQRNNEKCDFKQLLSVQQNNGVSYKIYRKRRKIETITSIYGLTITDWKYWEKFGATVWKKYK